MKSIEDVLLQLGIAPNLKGFGYICEAVEILKNKRTSICDGVYRKIAERNGDSASRVEKAIRHAITKVDTFAWVDLGGSGMKNSEFLYTLVLIIKREEKKKHEDKQ